MYFKDYIQPKNNNIFRWFLIQLNAANDYTYTILFQVSIKPNGSTSSSLACNGTTLECSVSRINTSGIVISPNTFYYVTVVVSNTLFKTEFTTSVTSQKAGTKNLLYPQNYNCCNSGYEQVHKIKISVKKNLTALRILLNQTYCNLSKQNCLISDDIFFSSFLLMEMSMTFLVFLVQNLVLHTRV